jgi:hypothetical protein
LDLLEHRGSGLERQGARKLLSFILWSTVKGRSSLNRSNLFFEIYKSLY